MSASWTRSPIENRCGLCGREIPAGQPQQQLMGAQLRHAKVRCVDCADGEVPADLPAQPERREEPPILVPVRQFAGLPLDWSVRALGERDPGEEG